MGDQVEDEAAESPFEMARENLRRDNVRKALDAVIRERIRQIESNTLKKLECSRTPIALMDAARRASSDRPAGRRAWSASVPTERMFGA